MKSVKRHNESLFLRMLAALILLAVLPSAIIGYIVYTINRTHHIEQVSSLMDSLAADRELMTRLVIEKQRDSLGFLARDPNTAALAAELAAGTDSPAKASFLEQMVNRSPFFGGLSVIDISTGRRRSAGAFPQALLESAPDLKQSQGKPFAAAKVLPGGKGVLLIGQPVYGSGKEAGSGAMILGVSSLAMIEDVYDDSSMLGQTGESFLSDSTGLALTPLRYSSHKERGHPIDAYAMQDCLLGNSKDFVITEDYIGVPTAMSYRPVKGYGGCVMVHMRASEVMAPVKAVRNMIAAIVLSIILAVTLVSLFVVKRLIRMDKVRTRLEEDLADHLSQMETTVAERTSELNTEIKNRVEAEHQLRENKAFLEDIVSNVHEAIWAVNTSPDGGFRFMWSNANGEKLLGARQMGAGRPLQEAFGPDLGERLTRHYSECVEKGVVHCEETFNTDSGPRVFLMTLVPVKDDTGQVQQIIGSAMDITEKKQLESEMVKAQKLESLGVLAGGIAHDFNNLLAAIRLNVSMLKLDPAQSPDSLEMLRIVDTSAGMAANLTNQLLTFAKGGKPVKEIISVSAFLKDVADFSLRGTKNACSLALGEDLLNIEADPGQLSQVLNNILINAGQAMPEGGVVKLSAGNIEVSTTQAALPLKPGKYVKITVEDTGPGIPEEYLPRIFDPYFTTKKSGSGLGLASSYSIIKNHGGSILVYSVTGSGTRFEVFIPGLTQKAPAPAEEQATPARSPAKVLVMDDDHLVRKSICRVLDSLGYEPIEATDGLEAALEYEKGMKNGKLVDAVILDLTVRAGMGGQEAAAMILKLDPSAKIFVSSGYSDTPVIANYRDYGFTGFLQKPYDAPELDKKLRAVLAEKGV
ncbi:MAG: response regulator [Deltaproteobacteria bacterium]|nr:response regulator [Deltaproteobacteria bacterium]